MLRREVICLTVTLVVALLAGSGVNGHGFLFDPPARSSAWLVDSDFKHLANYDHNQMYCGGFLKQWQENGGRCGICGDDWSQPEPRDYEKGGAKYLGKIVKVYKKNTPIPVSVIITANHIGHFEFRICNVDGWATDATQECLNKTVLKVQNTNDYKYRITNTTMSANYSIVLPHNFECNHCVLQWKYVTGNTWGTDPETNRSCVGCGPVQENFLGCADISIRENLNVTTPATPTPTTATTTKAPIQTTTAGHNNHEMIVDVEIFESINKTIDDSSAEEATMHHHHNHQHTTNAPPSQSTASSSSSSEGYSSCKSRRKFGNVLDISKLVTIYCNRICKNYCPLFMAISSDIMDMNDENRLACIETCPLLCSCD